MTLMKRTKAQEASRSSVILCEPGIAMRRLATILLVSVTAASLMATQLALAIKLSPEGREKFFWTGDQFVITCQNNNNIKNVRIRLMGPDDQEITTDRSHRIHSVPNLPSGNRLVVMNASEADSGKYRCTIGSAGDKISFKEELDFSIVVFRNLEFYETPHELILPVGHEGALTCRVASDPNVSVNMGWTKDGDSLVNSPNQTNYRVVDYDPNSGLSQVVLSNVRLEDAGEYRCIVSSENDKVSKIVSWPIVLRTSFAPRFKENMHIQWIDRPPPATETRAGQPSTGAPSRNGNNGRSRNNNSKQPSRSTQEIRVELTCQCEANPAAEILWTRSGSKILLEKGNPEYILDINSTVLGHNTISKLVLNYNYNGMDSNSQIPNDEYICMARNSLGSAEKVYRVKQGDPPPAFVVERNPILQVTGSSLTFKLLEPIGLARGLEIEPPVDAFRIRAENPKTHEQPDQAMDTTGNGFTNRLTHQQIQHLKRHQHSDPSVLIPIDITENQLSQILLKNYTVHLGSLPGGPQRLFLEAHNAVGWSLNSTYLGEYDIVNSSSCSGSLWQLSNTVLVGCVFILTSYLNQALALG